MAVMPVSLASQHFAGCPVDHHLQESYENPLFEKWLSGYDVKWYYLDLEVSNENTYIEGSVTILSEALRELDTLVFQLIDELEVTGVEVGGNPVADFEHREDAVYVPVDGASGSLITTSISYRGDASQDRGFFAGITSAYDNTNQQWVTYTLSEPLNARDWFPVKQVLADKADSVWVDLTCNRSLMAGSNGILEGITLLPENRHTFHWRSRYPIAYYLVSLAVADYRDYSFHAPLSDANDSVLVQNYIYDDDDYLNEWKSRIDDTGEMIRLFSELVIDYPFAREKYGHAVAPMGGGMEHQTMTTLANFNFNLVAHELAHQWFGNNLTCGNWQDIWINEGFASYFEYIALENMVSRESADQWLDNARSVAFEETGSVFVPEEEADDPSRVFDYGLSYKKGAILLHMIRYELDNDSVFFAMLKAYSVRYADSVATAEEFREVLELESGKDFTCFFDQWYYGRGYPVFSITGTHRNDTLFLESQQSGSDPGTPLFSMHFDLLVNTMSGEKMVRLYQDQEEQNFAIPVDDVVTGLVFDPGNDLLAKGHATHQLTGNRDVVIGPNPFTEKMLLQFSQLTEGVFLEVYNLKGALVLQTSVTTNPSEIDLSGLQEGAYVIRVITPEGNYTEKILKVAREK